MFLIPFLFSLHLRLSALLPFWSSFLFLFRSPAKPFLPSLPPPALCSFSFPLHTHSLCTFPLSLSPRHCSTLPSPFPTLLSLLFYLFTLSLLLSHSALLLSSSLHSLSLFISQLSLTHCPLLFLSPFPFAVSTYISLCSGSLLVSRLPLPLSLSSLPLSNRSSLPSANRFALSLFFLPYLPLLFSSLLSHPPQHRSPPTFLFHTLLALLLYCPSHSPLLPLSPLSLPLFFHSLFSLFTSPLSPSLFISPPFLCCY